MVKFCESCGCMLPEGAAFCPECGEKIAHPLEFSEKEVPPVSSEAKQYAELKGDENTPAFGLGTLQDALLLEPNRKSLTNDDGRTPQSAAANDDTV